MEESQIPPPFRVQWKFARESAKKMSGLRVFHKISSLLSLVRRGVSGMKRRHSRHTRTLSTASSTRGSHIVGRVFGGLLAFGID